MMANVIARGPHGGDPVAAAFCFLYDRRPRAGDPMIRKLMLLAAIVVVLGLAVFWFLTIPATVPAGALPAYTPDLANGKEMF